MATSAAARLERQKQKHQERLDYMDRAFRLVEPILTSPVVPLVGSYLLLEKYKDYVMENPDYNFYDRTSITAGVSSLQVAITSGFVAHSFGGPTGISQLIGALR